MAVSESVTDSSDGGGGRGAGVGKVFVSAARCTEGGSRASFPLDVGFPSSSAGVPRLEVCTRKASLTALVAVSGDKIVGKTVRGQIES